MAWVLVTSLYFPKAVEGTCDQRRLRSDYADVQADLSLRRSHKSHSIDFSTFTSPNMTRVFVHTSLYSPEAVEGICDLSTDQTAEMYRLI